jgi:hypothetical protein
MAVPWKRVKSWWRPPGHRGECPSLRGEMPRSPWHGFVATGGHHYGRLRDRWGSAAQRRLQVRCSANGGRALVLDPEVGAEREWSSRDDRASRMEGRSLLAKSGGLLGERRSTQQVLRRNIAVTGSEKRSEKDRRDGSVVSHFGLVGIRPLWPWGAKAKVEIILREPHSRVPESNSSLNFSFNSRWNR